MSPRILAAALGAAALAGGLVWAFWPEPVPVDIATVERGPLQGTVAAEGVTRVRDPYLVTAPISGTAARSPVEVGDRVERGETVVAVIEPAAPALLDVRARAEAEATLREAEAAVRLAATLVSRAETELAHAEGEHERNITLAARGVIPQRMLEDSLQRVKSEEATVRAARSELAMREATLARAQVLLQGPVLEPNAGPERERVEVRAPESGTVLAVENVSARLVQAGEALLTIGDLADLEIEVELLSADAVRLAPGARAMIERWGGEAALGARVLRIDPRGFTRVSALGIEEQRVRVHLAFDDPPAARPGLGDAFRVFVRIVTWEEPEALRLPVGALFRAGGDWAVFRVEDGRARQVAVTLGNRTETEAHVRAGLEPGDRVVVYPGDRVSDGARVTARATGE